MWWISCNFVLFYNKAPTQSLHQIFTGIAFCIRKELALEHSQGLQRTIIDQDIMTGSQVPSWQGTEEEKTLSIVIKLGQ